jgi:hypothetical protein
VKSLAVSLLLTLAAVTARSATFTVTNTSNSGPGSLYQAITDSNVDWDPDTIVFNIPGPGVHVIDVSGKALPDILRPVLIDGYTQSGAHPNTLAVGNDAVILIQVKGTGASGFQFGFWIKGGGTRIRGLSITGFAGAILTDGPGGGNAIEGNFIGLDPSGQTAAPNAQGLRISSLQTTLGGSDPSQRNVISGNRGLGALTTSPAVVAGNYIGTNATGNSAIPNGFGIKVTGGTADAHTIIGGADSNSANLVSGNTSNGIQVGDFSIGGGCPFCFDNSIPADYTLVSHNLVGTTADGLHALGNGTGIWIYDSNHTVIGASDPAAGNVVAFNTYAGVAVQNFLASHPCLGNSILSNRIYGNGTRSIVLMTGRSDPPRENDPGDADTGPNNLQNYPLLTHSTIYNGIVTSNGTLNSVPNTQFLIQFFADSRSITTPSQVYLGSTTVTTDGNGNASFAVNFPISDVNVYVNAAATNLATGDTSEFYYNPPRLVNVSTRLRVQTGDNVLIGGFIVGPEGGTVVVRGIGPSLSAYGVAGVLEDPIIYLSDSTGRSIGINDNWRTDFSSGSLGPLSPTNDLESALFRSLEPGAYTVVLANKDGGTGVGLVEVYFRAGNGAALTNISTRGFVEACDNVMIGGFTATDSNGPARYVIRAIGPSLENAGISNPLADPIVELHDGNGELTAVNDNWQDGDETSIRETGLAPKNFAESVLLEILQPGAYTAIVRGKDGGTGVALIEVYNLR